MRRAVLLLLASLLAGAGCRQPVHHAATVRPDPAGFQGALALGEVQTFLALGPRDATTPGGERAARYLAARLAELGIEASVDRFDDRSVDGPAVFRNVIGRLPGKTPAIIVLAAHYDTKSGIAGFDGANDSGSGVGLLLALGAWYRAAPGASEIRLAFLDGEECLRSYGPHDGFHGSRRLAARLVEQGLASRVRAVIVLDMIGDRDLSVTVPRNGTPALAAAAFRAAAEDGHRAAFAYFPGEILDDHQAFLNAGMPALDLIDFEYGSAPGLNDYWHTAADTLDKLSVESLGTVGRVVIRMVEGLEAQPASGSSLSPDN